MKKYMPFARLLRQNIEEKCGPWKDRRSRKFSKLRAARVLGVSRHTLSNWVYGLSLPSSPDRRLTLGVFFGWVRDEDDAKGMERTLRYFSGSEPLTEDWELEMTEREREGR